MVILVTSRTEDDRETTERFLKKNGVRYDHIIFGAPAGERILVNDDKPGGLVTSIGVRAQRDKWVDIVIREDDSL